MTIDEAIKHCEEYVDGHERIKQIKAVTLEECKCAEEQRQLAEWLKELKMYRDVYPNRFEPQAESEELDFVQPRYPEKGCDYFSEQKHERKQFIWIVTYWDFDSSEPVVTAFNNEETANKCYKYFKKCHSFCYLDKCPIYSRFLESED